MECVDETEARSIHYSMTTRLRERLEKFGITFRVRNADNEGEPEFVVKRLTVVDALKTHFQKWHPDLNTEGPNPEQSSK